MRYAIIHCRNPRCLLKVWVPENLLGSNGRCPTCGYPIEAPAFVPPDELQEGPPLMQLEHNDRHTTTATPVCELR
jgi:hypothetical protein